MWKTYAKYLILTYFTSCSIAYHDKLIYDYFVYKNVRHVVGYSCKNTTDNFRLLKALHNSGIYTAIKGAGMKFDVGQFLRAKYWTTGVFVDLRCRDETVTTIIAQSSKRRMYDYSYNWLILGTSFNESISTLNDTSYNILTDVVVSIPGDDHYDLYDVFNHCQYRGGSMNVTKLGIWSKNEGLTITLTQAKIMRRANMHGMRLRMSGVILYRPKNMRLENYMNDITARSLDSMQKFVYAMIMHVAQLFNFSVHASEISWWDKHSLHGTIFDVLKTNDIDFGSNPRVMVSERLDFATLIGGAWPVRPCFFLLRMPSTKIKLDIFLRPFTGWIWYLILLFTGILVVITYLIIKMEYESSNVEQITNAVITTVGVVSQQGASYFPKRQFARVAVVQFVLCSWVLYNYYSGSIVSARLSEPLDKLEDNVAVLADTSVKVAAEATPYLNYLLQKNTPESSYFRKKRWDPLPDSQRYLPLEEGLRLVSQGKLAYHTDPNSAYPYVERMFDYNQVCQLTEIHLFKQSVMGMYASHNGQFTEIARIGLTKMFNMGLRDRQIKYWSSRKPHCQQDALSTRGITIREVAPILILLAAGILLSGAICILENYLFERPRVLKTSLGRGKIIFVRGNIVEMQLGDLDKIELFNKNRNLRKRSQIMDS